MTASVLDVVQFSALPIETQELCHRVYGGTPEEVDELRETAKQVEDEDWECDGECDTAGELRSILQDIAVLAENAI